MCHWCTRCENTLEECSCVSFACGVSNVSTSCSNVATVCGISNVWLVVWMSMLVMPTFSNFWRLAARFLKMKVSSAGNPKE